MTLSKMITKVNKIIFPFLGTASFFLIFIESYKYSGFLSRYIGVSANFIVVIVLTSAFFVVREKLNFLTGTFFKINNFVFPVSTVLYFAMQYLEATHFHNFVFSKYHILPNTFFYFVFLSLSLFFVSSLAERKFVRTNIVNLAVIIIFTVIFLNGMTETSNLASYRDMYILSHLDYSHEAKMHEQLGVYYDYIRFVKANTPDNALILIPPMQGPWYSSGNVGIDRYFLFPRKLGSGTYNGPMDLKGYDYVLMAWGEWGNDESDFAWPKIPVKAEKMIFFDPATHITKEVKGNYDPKTSRVNGNWGLIKLLK